MVSLNRHRRNCSHCSFALVVATTLLALSHGGGGGGVEAGEGVKAACTAGAEECSAAEGGGTSSTAAPTGGDRCRLYLATSTIPNAGLGMFTAVHLEKGDEVGHPDLAIPVVDHEWHIDSKFADDYHWLWSQYHWDPSSIGAIEEEAASLSACVPGLGAMPNCHFRLNNVDETWAKSDTAGLHRGKDPGAGAFTDHHDRHGHAEKALDAGSEIFVSYGESWFEERESYMGLIPLTGSYLKATKFLKKYNKLLERDTDAYAASPTLKDDLWNLIVDSPYKSRPLAALPKTWDVADRATKMGIEQTVVESSIRSVDWLEQHGKCLDNIRPERSTLPQAGRGAFATRSIANGDIVAPAPLIHIVDRDLLLMYGESSDEVNSEGEAVRDYRNVTGTQLLLNYCFGHARSTLLLCPYGSGTSYINHDGDSPNAKVVWTSEERAIIHDSEWTKRPIEFWGEEYRSGLEFDYVATRDIEAGEEIFIDYGAEWADAWERHVREWKPVPGAEGHVDASELNCFDTDCAETPPIRTQEEQVDEPYPDYVHLFCHFSKKRGHRNVTMAAWRHSDDWRDGSSDYHACKILARFDTVKDKDGAMTYTCELNFTEDEAHGEEDTWEDTMIVGGIPQHNIRFIKTPYTSDMYLPNAFRHEMMIPDEVMPDVWKNKDL